MTALLTESVFIAKHMAFLEGIRRYAWTARGRRWLSDTAVEELTLRSSCRLPATNVFARIAVAQAGAPLIRKVAKSAAPMSFLTLTPVQFAVPLAEAAAFDTRVLHDWVSERLSGMHWVGMIDAGYFSNYSVLGRESTLAWHAHVLVWGATETDVLALTDALNSRWPSLIPGSKVAVPKVVGKHGAESRWWYSAKAPLTESRVMGSVEKIDRTTGEITTGMRIKDRPLRPRDAAHICELMVNRTISDLLLAGGSGIVLRERMLRTAKRELRTVRAAERRRMTRVLFGDADRLGAS